MKIIGKMAAAAVLSLASMSAAAAPAAAAVVPWAEDVTYWLGDTPVGGTRYYCDGRVISWGETGNYTHETWNHWHDC